MTANEISQIVNNGRNADELDGNDYHGHVGILICHAYLHGIPMDIDVLSRYLKIDGKDLNNAFTRLNNAGMFLPYGWLAKNKNAMLRMPPKKAEACIQSWTQIAAMSSGYLEPLPNSRYVAASGIYKAIQSI